jgi:hypothetical protein
MFDSLPAPAQDNTISSSHREALEPGLPSRRRPVMDLHPSEREARLNRFSPMAAAAILLSVYVAMYLAVGAIVHLLGTPSINARVPGDWIELAAGATAQTATAEQKAAPKEHDDVHVD